MTHATLRQYYQDRYHVLHQPMPWFGSGVEESLEPLGEADFHRPVGHRTIAQLIAHMVAWRRTTALRLQGKPYPKIELNTPDDWPDYRQRTKAEMLAELAQTKDELLAALESFDYARLEEALHPDYYYRWRHLIDGAVQHDIYHLGQINLIKSILKQ